MSHSETVAERVVSLPVINPETDRPSRSFRFAGKMDLLEAGVINDYKAVGDPERFIRQKTIGFQADLYALAAMHAGHEIKSVVYRLLTIPTIRFCSKDADAAAYESRCFAWLHDDAAKIQEHELFLNPGRLDSSRKWLWGMCKRILENRRTEFWATNELACYCWERACEYLPLCECIARGDGWQDLVDESYEDSDAHPELNGELEPSGLDVVTYTSLTTLALCERKFWWRYHCKLRKRQDFAESMWTGSAMHYGLERYAAAGLQAGLDAVNEYADGHPVIGEDQAHYQDQQIARARAMVRAAAERWPVGGSHE